MIQELKDIGFAYNAAQIRLSNLSIHLQAVYKLHPGLFSKKPDQMGASELMRMGQALAKLLDDLEKDNG